MFYYSLFFAFIICDVIVLQKSFRKKGNRRNMFVVLVTTLVLLCGQVGNAAVFLRHEIDLQAHPMGSQGGTFHNQTTC